MVYFERVKIKFSLHWKEKLINIVIYQLGIQFLPFPAKSWNGKFEENLSALQTFVIFPNKKLIKKE